jgi:hypothetical protein
MVSGKKSKAGRGARPLVVNRRSTPWGLIAAAVVVLAFAGAAIGYPIYLQAQEDQRREALAVFNPTPENQDPSTAIPGVEKVDYGGGLHVAPEQQVAYTHNPPIGGRHDGVWAACNGVVYPTAVRNENMVHALEHGAAWIAYNPDQVTGDALAVLVDKVENQPYTMLSPYPGLDQPVALQSWGHQLKLSDVNDPRIDQFLTALRLNQYQHPEPGASCQEQGPGLFDQDAPPPFAPVPPATAVDGTTVLAETDPAPAG